MELHIGLDETGTGDLATSIYAQIRVAVLDGRLAPGVRVPPTRQLARSLGVARGTVSAAYDRLVAEQFLDSRAGSGTYVTDACRQGPRLARHARPGVVSPVPLWAGVDPPPAFAASRREAGPAAYDLTLGVPDVSLFPLALWRRLVSAQLRRAPHGWETYDVPGNPLLQAEIARYAGLSRHVVASRDDVVVTTGAQQALDLVARVLVEPGAVVAVEDPGYTAARRLLETHRARVVGVPVDGEGLVVEALPDDARVVYVTPSHQFPTGVAMSLARRTALLEWAIRHDAVVVEDDYDSEFRFADRPLEPLQSLDADGRVVYVGSFSKSLLPALRVGYAIVPTSVQRAFREAKRVSDWNGDPVTQGALTRFLAEGHHAAHVRRATKVYRERRETLLSELDGQLSGVVDVVPSAAGLHVCAVLRDERVSDVDVAEAALAARVRVDPLSVRYGDQPARQGLALGFGAVGAEAIPLVVRRLAGAIDAVR
ncbi:GntR family transcriptional regulator [Intrasporangium oryzae NRRL B-24470]|uniref:GntR family transcriptional regulator n=1 Tax=Intrasporangium oryzae NRRL B-24470 TaxID=1386089 RepID=W9GB22_9MICO|nr:PLP-dependent aminotransferase family protein [Intrasporangium oryzae]EWT03280.1 GntR family transcriptional regulator [Intrasporangium oryzae NRRL B-24470]